MNTPKTITKYEKDKILSRLKIRERLITRIMTETGLRIADTLNLTVEDIKRGEVTERKTKKTKQIKLSGWTVNLLKRYLGLQKSGLLFPQSRKYAPNTEALILER